MKLSDLALDPERQEKGAWVDDIPEMEGLRLLVRGTMNADWRRLQSKLLEAIPRKKRAGGRLDVDDTDRITQTLLLNACLLDWEGLEDDDGKPIPYNKDMARKLLFEPEYRAFRDGVVYAANIVAQNISEDQKETSGNLVRLSAGHSSGEPKSSTG
jgi:hypothetical protein